MSSRGWERNRRGFRDLQDRTAKVFESIKDLQTVRGPDVDPHVLGAVASWCSYVQWGIGAIRLLHDAGLGLFAAPIRRAVLEHAVCSMAVALEPAAFRSYERALHYQASKTLAAVKEAKAAMPKGLEDYLAWKPSDQGITHDGRINFKRRSQDLGEDGKKLLVAWQHLSDLSHANFATANLFLQYVEDDGWPTLMNAPQVDQDPWRADAAAADEFILAVDALSRVLQGDPLRSKVQRLNRRKDRLLDDARRLAAGDAGK